MGSITQDSSFHDKNLALYSDSAGTATHAGRGLWSAEHHLHFRDESYKNQTAPNGQVGGEDAV
jgi:hypothetical protein